jgi:hypothetical protein
VVAFLAAVPEVDVCCKSRCFAGGLYGWSRPTFLCSQPFVRRRFLQLLLNVLESGIRAWCTTEQSLAGRTTLSGFTFPVYHSAAVPHASMHMLLGFACQCHYICYLTDSIRMRANAHFHTLSRRICMYASCLMIRALHVLSAPVAECAGQACPQRWQFQLIDCISGCCIGELGV